MASQRHITISNRDGIHCRPASVILARVQECTGHKFRLICLNGESELNSIISLLSLALQKDDEATLEVEGPEAESVCEQVAGLFEFNFDFPPRNEQEN